MFVIRKVKVNLQFMLQNMWVYIVPERIVAFIGVNENHLGMKQAAFWVDIGIPQKVLTEKTQGLGLWETDICLPM